VLDTDLVVAVFTAVRLSECNELVAPTKVDDVFGAPVGPVDILVSLSIRDRTDVGAQPKRTEYRAVELKRAFDIANGEVDVVNH
jgi:hypothetical protein